MATPIESLTDQEIQNLIDNHRRQNVTTAPRYLEALEEQARRKGRGLTFSKSMAVIRDAARDGRFLSYKELADASGAEWTNVRYAIGPHLWSLVEYAHRQGWPMLSAIVVNKQHVSTGEMEPDTLKGFVTAARDLGHVFSDPHDFLKQQQQHVFEWAQNGNKADVIG